MRMTSLLLAVVLSACGRGATAARDAAVSKYTYGESPAVPQTVGTSQPGWEDRLVVARPEQLFNVARPPSGTLSAQEVSLVVDAGAKVGFRTGYYRNGCQSRVHVLWAALPKDIRAKIGKIWVFQPSIYAPILKQKAIGHPDDVEVKWDFHVALLFEDNGGVERIVDLALGNEPIPLQRWLSTFAVPDKSLLIRTDGKYYSYNLSGGALNSMYEYVGNSCLNAWMIEDVAFDKVGAQLLADSNACATLVQYSSNAIAAKNELNSSNFDSKHPGAGCATLKNLFFSERARVLGLVDDWARPDGCAKE